MTSYCAFLRGVNIGKKKIIMKEACDVLKKSGLHNVSSVLATGNLLFESDLQQSELKAKIEKNLSEHYDEGVYLFVKSKVEIEKMLQAIPFDKEEDHHHYIFICEDGFEKILLSEYEKIKPIENERAAISQGYFFWECPKGKTLDSGFTKILGRKAMKEKFTSRNVNTLVKVLKKMEESQDK